MAGMVNVWVFDHASVAGTYVPSDVAVGNVFEGFAYLFLDC